MRLDGYRGLLAALALAIFSPLAWGQGDDYGRAYEELLDRNKVLAEQLIRSSQEIIILFDKADSKAIVEYLSDRIGAMEKAVRAFDKNSDVWRKFNQVDKLIKDKITETRQEAKADVRYQDLVEQWERNEKDAIQFRIDVEKEVAAAETLIARLKADRKLIEGYIQARQVAKGLEKAKNAVKGLQEMNGNMQKILAAVDQRKKAGFQP